MSVGLDDYGGGHLIECLNDDQRDHIDELAVELWGAAQQTEGLLHDANLTQSFDFKLQLKRKPLIRA